MSGPGHLDLAQVRARLAEGSGRRFWRSLDELAGSEAFEELLHREFPRHAAELPDGVDRRRFLQLAAGSLAFGGLTACTRQPREKIVPYVEQPEQIVPGEPLFYATAMTQGGYAVPLLAESLMGRPTKVEGNPDHPDGTRGSDRFAQASLLQMYDPDRSRVVRELRRIRTYSAFLADTRSALRALETLGDVRLRVLTGTVTSPLLAATLGRLLERYPAARWHRWEPVCRDAVVRGATAAFARPVDPVYDLAAATTVLSLDSDFLTSGPRALAHAADFMRLRRPRAEGSMNRLYAAESAPTSTGTVADHRLPLPPALVGKLTAAVAAALGVPGVTTPPELAQGHLAEWVAAVAADLKRDGRRGLVIAGDPAPPEVHVLAHAMNAALGAVGTTVRYVEPVEADPVPHLDSLRELTTAMAAGEVDVLLVVGGNPVYDAPADLGFAEAMLKVGRRVRLGLYDDETSELCQWHLPMAHYLESWGDARTPEGTVTLTQPLIEPLHGGKTAAEVVAALIDDEPRPADELLRAHWEGRGGFDGPFDKFWRRCLHDGFVPGTASPETAPVLDPAAAGAAAARLAASGGGGGDAELVFRPDPTVWDGRYGNNGWLQECPKPLTLLTWDNAALMGPAMAARLGIENEQVVLLQAGGRQLEAPAWVLPGHPDGAVTLHLGYGRWRAGRVGSGTGVNAFRLRSADGLWSAGAVTVVPTPRRAELASTQLHNNIPLESEEAEKRHLVRTASLERFRETPDFAQQMGHGEGPSLFPDWEYPGYAWGLSIDLGACTGCNACVLACQAENNVPVVGKQQVRSGREMQWIRIDRYFEGDLEEPTVHHQPVMCMHCERAPCEIVCPVAATVHSHEGLNDMVYNRCVGTRYCSNNCPYKVRRFNFLKYTDHEEPLLKMMRNPEVTVRTRGVMEKCTYCVQRINRSRIIAEREGREIEDGEIVTACQQACPTSAIVFGDINDPESAVSREKASPRNYGILEELNTKPRTTYLAKVTNPHPALAGSDAHHGEGSHA